MYNATVMLILVHCDENDEMNELGFVIGHEAMSFVNS